MRTPLLTPGPLAHSVLATGLVVLLSAGASAQQPPLPLQHAPEPTTAAISAVDLMSRLYIFADDSMQGRLSGTPGDLRGTTYIAAEAARLGLVGGGDAGTYFQGIPLYRSAPLTSMRVILGSTHFLVGRDFIPVDNSAIGRVQQIDGSRVVFGGTLGDTLHMLGRRDGNERLVVVAARVDSAGRPTWADGRRELIYRFSGAAAIALVGLDAMDSVTRDQLLHVQSRVVDFPMISGGPPGLFMDPGAIVSVPAFLYISRAMAEQLLGRPLASAVAGQTGGVVHGDVTFKPELVPARNVLAILPGSDPVLKNQYVVIGAHTDHMGLKIPPVDPDFVRAVNTVVRPSGGERAPFVRDSDDAKQIRHIVDSLHALHPPRLDSVFNGADEGGSGVVAALEIAEAFASAPVKPKRSILFIWHGGDENGLAGSASFVTHPTVARDAIVAELNLDMIGRGDASDLAGGGPAYLETVGSRRQSTELGDIVDSIAKAERQPFVLDESHDAKGDRLPLYCRGDQFNYGRFGIPSMLFTTGEHRDYRQVTDEAEHIDYPKLARVTSLVFDVVTTIANRDHRLIVDKPRPSSSASCVP